MTTRKAILAAFEEARREYLEDETGRVTDAINAMIVEGAFRLLVPVPVPVKAEPPPEGET